MSCGRFLLGDEVEVLFPSKPPLPLICTFSILTIFSSSEVQIMQVCILNCIAQKYTTLVFKLSSFNYVKVCPTRCCCPEFQEYLKI